MYNTPIDEYYFWKSLIEEKQDARESVPDKMFELLTLAEIKMTHFLARKHRLSDCPTVPIYVH